MRKILLLLAILAVLAYWLVPRPVRAAFCWLVRRPKPTSAVTMAALLSGDLSAFRRGIMDWDAGQP